MRLAVRWLIAPIALLSVPLSLVLSAPAAAETKIRDDKVGDAPAVIDATRARYTHGDGVVKVKARIPDLGDRGRAVLSITRFTSFEFGHVLRILKRPAQDAKVRLFYFNHIDLEPRSCDDMSGTWGESTIKLSVARSCLEEDATRRVYARFGIQRGQQIDRVPAVRRLTRD